MINSKQNDFIKEIRSLSQKKYRDNLGLYIVDGIKPVLEALSLNKNIFKIVATENGLKKLPSISDVVIVSDSVFSFISEEKSPQGVMALLYKDNESLASPKGDCLILDGVSDPSNVGAIIRTAAACGFNEVYLTDDSADAYSPKAVRSSMSTIFRIHTMRGRREDILSVIDKPLYVADMNGTDLYRTHIDGDICLVIGNEGNGVSDLVKSKADYTVSINMKNGVESLNAAVSAGILMYTLKRD